MNKKQIVYTPTKISISELQVGTINKDDYYKSFNKITNVNQIEAYVFTPEELKELLEGYTSAILNNVELADKYIEEVYDSNFEDTALSNELIFLRTDGDGMPYAANKVTINKESITNQLELIKKELEL